MKSAGKSSKSKGGKTAKGRAHPLNKNSQARVAPKAMAPPDMADAGSAPPGPPMMMGPAAAGMPPARPVMIPGPAWLKGK